MIVRFKFVYLKKIFMDVIYPPGTRVVAVGELSRLFCPPLPPVGEGTVGTLVDPYTKSRRPVRVDWGDVETYHYWKYKKDWVPKERS